MPVDLHGAGDVAGLVEQHVLVGLHDHDLRVAEVLGEPVGRDEALRVRVLREPRVGVGSAPSAASSCRLRTGAPDQQRRIRGARTLLQPSTAAHRRYAPRLNSSPEAVTRGHADGARPARRPRPRRRRRDGWPPRSCRRGSSPRPRSTTTGPTPTTRRSRAPSTRSARSPRTGRARPAASSAAAPSRRSGPACTSTAASASARPTCSPRSGSRRPAASTSAPSSSTRRSSARSATRQAVRLLTGSSLLAIDEFELDDPGDTMLMSRLLGELVGTGTRIGATSNTPPNALGEGRFAAADFLREIQGLSDRFTTVRIDGLDYRRRDLEGRRPRRRHDASSPTLPARPGRDRRRLRRADRAPRDGASRPLRRAGRRARTVGIRGRARRCPARRRRCASSRSSTGSTTRRCGSSRPACRSTACSARRCSRAATARSTCARSRGSSR